MQDVNIVPRDPLTLASVVGDDRAGALATDAAADAVAALAGRSVLNVNSTATGGGVAEMLRVLLAYVRGVGIDARWLVVEAGAPFFAVTKRIHNHLYGGVGDGGALGPDAHEIYEAALRAEADELATHLRPGDVVILHDPQTAGLARYVRDCGARVVWRCHVGVDETDENTDKAWNFLRPYLEGNVDHYVFTHREFAPDWIDQEAVSAIWPSIDPFAPKNQELSDEKVEAILTQVGLVAGRAGDTTYTRSDGTVGRVESYCDIFRNGPAPGVDTPLVVQVSRWDVMKDMEGVMHGFAQYVDSGRDAHLVLAGPAVTAVADDPEGGQVLQQCWEAWRGLPHVVRHRVQLTCVPMHDIDENAVIVNALQRHARVLVQKSIAEGFGLTVAEGMLKGRPVVASAVGGLVDQVVDGETGYLVRDPLDLAAFGGHVAALLDDPARAHEMGEAGRQRAIDTHLGDTQLQKWLGVLQRLSALD